MSEIKIGGKPKLADLPEKQRQVFIFIEREIDEKGVSPSYEEIASHLGNKSHGSAQQAVQALKLKGFLTSEPGKHNSIKIVK